jgi:hypothetical protein
MCPIVQLIRKRLPGSSEHYAGILLDEQVPEGSIPEPCYLLAFFQYHPLTQALRSAETNDKAL